MLYVDVTLKFKIDGYRMLYMTLEYFPFNYLLLFYTYTYQLLKVVHYSEQLQTFLYCRGLEKQYFTD